MKFVFLFAIPIGWFPLFCLPDHFCVLLYHLVCYSVLLVFYFYFGYWILHFWRIFIFSSFLLKNSLYSSILFPSSGNILIMNVWNSLFDKLLISISLFIFPGIFFCSFNWDQFLYLLILFNSASNWEVAICSSILTWKISCTEEPGRPQSTGSQRVRHKWATEHMWI